MPYYKQRALQQQFNKDELEILNTYAYIEIPYSLGNKLDLFDNVPYRYLKEKYEYLDEEGDIDLFELTFSYYKDPDWDRHNLLHVIFEFEL